MDFLVRARLSGVAGDIVPQKWTAWQWSVGTRCTIRVAIEGEFHLLFRDLVGFVCAVHEGVVVGDSFKFLMALSGNSTGSIELGLW